MTLTAEQKWALEQLAGLVEHALSDDCLCDDFLALTVSEFMGDKDNRRDFENREDDRPDCGDAIDRAERMAR